MVFLAAAGTTAVLSLDATIVLLTPIVFATAARLPTSPRPHVYACSHLANSASLLLPVSNLTNLLAFTACGVSFTRFAALMALPWLVAIAVEWVVLSRVFADDLRQTGGAGARRRRRDAAPAAAGLRPHRRRAHPHRLRDQLDRGRGAGLVCHRGRHRPHRPPAPGARSPTWSAPPSRRSWCSSSRSEWW